MPDLHRYVLEILVFRCYAEPQTVPAINVQLLGHPVCYGALAPGKVVGGLHVKIGDTVYHAVQ